MARKMLPKCFPTPEEYLEMTPAQVAGSRKKKDRVIAAMRHALEKAESSSLIDIRGYTKNDLTDDPSEELGKRWHL